MWARMFPYSSMHQSHVVRCAWSWCLWTRLPAFRRMSPRSKHSSDKLPLLTKIFLENFRWVYFCKKLALINVTLSNYKRMYLMCGHCILYKCFFLKIINLCAVHKHKLFVKRKFCTIYKCLSCLILVFNWRLYCINL